MMYSTLFTKYNWTRTSRAYDFLLYTPPWFNGIEPSYQIASDIIYKTISETDLNCLQIVSSSLAPSSPSLCHLSYR